MNISDKQWSFHSDESSDCKQYATSDELSLLTFSD